MKLTQQQLFEEIKHTLFENQCLPKRADVHTIYV